MAKEEKVTLEGTVTDTLPDGQYMVEVEGGHQILGYTSGKMRRFNIRNGGVRLITAIAGRVVDSSKVLIGQPLLAPAKNKSNFSIDRCNSW